MHRSDRLYGSIRTRRRRGGDDGEGGKEQSEEEESKAKRIKEEQRKEQEVDAMMRWGKAGGETRGDGGGRVLIQRLASEGARSGARW